MIVKIYTRPPDLWQRLTALEIGDIAEFRGWTMGNFVTSKRKLDRRGFRMTFKAKGFTVSPPGFFVERIK